MILIMTISSCSNMESDAEKACDLTTQTMEMMPEMLQLGMKAGFGDEESKKTYDAIKKLREILRRNKEDAKYVRDDFNIDTESSPLIL